MADWQCAAHGYIRNDRRYKLNTEVRGPNASWASWRVRGVKGMSASVPTARSDFADLLVTPARHVCSSRLMYHKIQDFEAEVSIIGVTSYYRCGCRFYLEAGASQARQRASVG